MFSEKDIELLEKKGINIEKANWQIEQFKKGSMPVNLVAPATPDNGIMVIDDFDYFAKKYAGANVKVTKFVPASGAASRMFKVLFEARDRLAENPEDDLNDEPDVLDFFGRIMKFAFYSDMEEMLKPAFSLERMVAEKKYSEILNALLDSDGLNYGSLPKGLLKFHQYAGKIGRTPFEEHLVEGAKYAASSDGMANLHFTVSPEHRDLFNNLKETIVEKYEDMYRVKYAIDFSIQKSSTDTLAVTPENVPFYDTDGNIFFRPGGHGALIENLNEIDSDIIFIKNIDNVVPEKYIEATVQYKQALAGVLIDVQQRVFRLCRELKEENNENSRTEAKELLKNEFSLSGKCIDALGHDPEEILRLLNRPIRVCGMVKNEGEPGGGPFLVKDTNECVSPQIIESSQIDLSDNQQKTIFSGSTHFNPVDLVCAVKDFEGNKYNLSEFVDKDTCFISKKSKNGKELKALELPGLWNGAMANWNTIFVEVPISTFNPVKTVNDLLRKAHQ